MKMLSSSAITKNCSATIVRCYANTRSKNATSQAFHHNNTVQPLPVRRWNSSTPSSTTNTTVNATATTPTHQQQQTYQEYMKEANDVMQQYHKTRELMKQGKLISKNKYGSNNTNSSNSNTVYIQGGVALTFMVVFLSMPFVGKKIATDEEFRKTYVPSWYDFTIQKPDRPWTRQELHEQMIEVQRTLHERAIAGDFTPEKLQQMKNAGTLSTDNQATSDDAASSNPSGISFDHFYPHRNKSSSSKSTIAHKDWDKVHPGLDDDEKVGE